MTELQHTIIDHNDVELNAMAFFQLAFRDLETEAKWRVLEYCERRLKADTYLSENVAQRPTEQSL